MSREQIEGYEETIYSVDVKRTHWTADGNTWVFGNDGQWRNIHPMKRMADGTQAAGVRWIVDANEVAYRGLDGGTDQQAALRSERMQRETDERLDAQTDAAGEDCVGNADYYKDIVSEHRQT